MDEWWDRFHPIIEDYFFGIMKDVFLFKMINADQRIFADFIILPIQERYPPVWTMGHGSWLRDS